MQLQEEWIYPEKEKSEKEIEKKTDIEKWKNDNKNNLKKLSQ